MILHRKHPNSTHDTDVFMITLPKISDIYANLSILIETADKCYCLVDINPIGLSTFHYVKHRNFT